MWFNYQYPLDPTVKAFWPTARLSGVVRGVVLLLTAAGLLTYQALSLDKTDLRKRVYLPIEAQEVISATPSAEAPTLASRSSSVLCLWSGSPRTYWTRIRQ